MRITTYNLNGIRSALSKGLADWMRKDDSDVYCFQETKAQPDQIDHSVFASLGYHTAWHSAEKKGYSGVGIASKTAPTHVETGCGNPLYDREGRVIRADFENLSVLSVYMPSGTTGDVRQEFKYGWLHFFFDYLQQLQQHIPNLVVCGDFNICHRAIDIHDPRGNAQSSGFLPEEREWMEKLFTNGWTDSFRHLNPEPHNYTWWSFRAGARAKNKGWRIDYCAASEPLAGRIKASWIEPAAVHSDHCPTGVQLG